MIVADPRTAAPGMRLAARPAAPFLVLCMLVSFVMWSAPARGQGRLERFEYRQVHMGLQVRILLYAPNENAAFDAAKAAFSEISRLDAVMSDYRPDSELMKLVQRADREPVRVSRDLFNVLNQAQTLAEQSDGAFDVTIGPLVRLWRTARRDERLPDPARIDSARALVGWRGLVLDSAAQTVRLNRPGIQIDLGGIAKGYAVDRAFASLRARGVTRALIEFGGDYRLGDPPPGTDGWDVEIAHADSAHRFMRLQNVAVASSGDTEQYVEVDGVRYSHVVDPRTGIGLTTRIAATVIAPVGITADALATALTVTTPEQRGKLLENYPAVLTYLRTVDSSSESEAADSTSTSWIR